MILGLLPDPFVAENRHAGVLRYCAAAGKLLPLQVMIFAVPIHKFRHARCYLIRLAPSLGLSSLM